jgi:amino acid transporter
MNNMEKPPIKEFILSIALIVLLIVLLNPFNFLMSDAVLMLTVALFVIAVGLIAGLALNERPRDERENVLVHTSARVGYISGIVILSLAIIIESLQHDLDFWLPLVFVIMILSKLIGRIYQENSSLSTD